MDVRRFKVLAGKSLRLAGELSLAAGFAWVLSLAQSGRVSADVAGPQRVTTGEAEAGSEAAAALAGREAVAIDEDTELFEGLTDAGREELRNLLERSNPSHADRRPGILGPPVIAPPGGDLGAPYGKKELTQGDTPGAGHYLDYTDELPEQPPEPGTDR